MMLRMVFCDLDGTLLMPYETALPSYTVDTLRRLADKGVTVVIASGRPYAQLKPLFPSLWHRLVFLCLDGALTMRDNCVLHQRPLPKQTVATLLDFYPEARFHGRQTVYRLGGATGDGIPVDTASAIGEPCLKLELPTGQLRPVPGDYRIAYRNDTVTELVAPCATKGNAAQTLMEKFDVSPDQAVAFGDSENDLSLLAAVGHPYVMAHSPLRPDLPALATSPNVVTTLRDLFNL